MSKVLCDNCKKEYDLDEKLEWKKAKCAWCGELFRISFIKEKQLVDDTILSSGDEDNNISCLYSSEEKEESIKQDEVKNTVETNIEENTNKSENNSIANENKNIDLSWNKEKIWFVWKIKTSYKLVLMSFKYIKRDWELLVYSFLSLLSTFVILATFIWIDIFYIWVFENLDKWNSDIFILVYVFLFYFVFSFITFFFNTAIITSVDRRNRWLDNKLWDWLRDSIKNIKAIFIWSAISALVSTLLRIIQSRFDESSIVGRIIVWIIWWMWNILTFFSFPLMILNKMWPKEAISKSWKLFKDTWWERAILHVWVGAFFNLLFFILLFISFFLVQINILFWLLSVLFFIIITFLLTATTDTILKTLLLHYVQTWEFPWDEGDIDLFLYIAQNKKEL